jgi:hypothetical protein
MGNRSKNFVEMVSLSKIDNFPLYLETKLFGQTIKKRRCQQNIHPIRIIEYFCQTWQ